MFSFPGFVSGVSGFSRPDVAKVFVDSQVPNTASCNDPRSRWYLFQGQHDEDLDGNYVYPSDSDLGRGEENFDPFAVFCYPEEYSEDEKKTITTSTSQRLLSVSEFLDDDDYFLPIEEDEQLPERNPSWYGETILIFLLLELQQTTDLRESVRERIEAFRRRLLSEEEEEDYFEAEGGGGGGGVGHQQMEALRQVVVGQTRVCGMLVDDTRTQLRTRMMHCRRTEDLMGLLDVLLGVEDGVVEEVLGLEKESLVEVLVDAFLCGSVCLRRRMEERRLLREKGIEGICPPIFVLSGKEIPKDVLRHVLSFIPFDREIILQLGLVHFDWCALVLSSWSASVHIRKANLFAIPTLVLRSMKEAVVHLGETKADFLSVKELQYLFGQECCGLAHLRVEAEHPMQFRAVCTIISTSQQFSVALRSLEFSLDAWIYQNPLLFFPLDLNLVFPSLLSVSHAPVVDWCSSCDLSEVEWFFPASDAGSALDLPVPLSFPSLRLEFGANWERLYAPSPLLQLSDGLVACQQTLQSLAIFGCEALCSEFLLACCVDGICFPVLKNLVFGYDGGSELRNRDVLRDRLDFTRFATPKLEKFLDDATSLPALADSRAQVASIREVVLSFEDFGDENAPVLALLLQQALRMDKLVISMSGIAVVLRNHADSIKFHFESFFESFLEMRGTELMKAVASTLCLRETTSRITVTLRTGVNFNSMRPGGEIPLVIAGLSRSRCDETQECLTMVFDVKKAEDEIESPTVWFSDALIRDRGFSRVEGENFRRFVDGPHDSGGAWWPVQPSYYAPQFAAPTFSFGATAPNSAAPTMGQQQAMRQPPEGGFLWSGADATGGFQDPGGQGGWPGWGQWPQAEGQEGGSESSPWAGGNVAGVPTVPVHAPEKDEMIATELAGMRELLKQKEDQIEAQAALIAQLQRRLHVSADSEEKEGEEDV